MGEFLVTLKIHHYSPGKMPKNRLLSYTFCYLNVSSVRFLFQNQKESVIAVMLLQNCPCYKINCRGFISLGFLNKMKFKKSQ